MIILGDARHLPIADKVAHCCVTSPPYWGLRDYGVKGQLGLERTPEEYVKRMVEVFQEVKRVLRDDGTLWLNIGDTYSGSWARSSNPGGKLNSPMQRSNAGSYVGDHSAEIVPPGCKPKDLVGVPWMLAFALRGDGWYLRSDIIWSKPNPMPESVTDRPTKAHEYIFLLSKNDKYFYNQEATLEPWTCDRDDMREKGVRTGLGYIQQGPLASNSIPASHRGSTFTNGKTSVTHKNVGQGPRQDNPIGRNKRTVWEVATQPSPEAHFATFPEDLIRPCILAGCPVGGIVLDPFLGSGTTALVAQNLNCRAIGVELNPSYIEIAKKRLAQKVLDFASVGNDV